MLQGFVIGYAKCGVDERLEMIRGFVAKIDNWALCDSFCMTLKFAEKNRERVYVFLQPFLASDDEYEIRFGVVMLLAHFITDEYIDCLLEWMTKIRHDGYYVKMAVAWTISAAFIKQRDKTLALIARQTLDPFTQNKAIQKTRESFRVSDEDKQLLKKYKL